MLIYCIPQTHVLQITTHIHSTLYLIWHASAYFLHHGYSLYLRVNCE